MFITYLKTAFRSLQKNKLINGINITGLAIGIAAIIFISQYVRFENSYDSHLNNNERIYRLVLSRHYSTGLDKSVGNNYIVGEIASQKIPEIENFLRCKKSTQFIKVNSEIFKEENVFFADSSFFNLFSYPVISGNERDFLKAPGVAIITESTAQKYFGNENPIGKTIYKVNPCNVPLRVQGVVKDVPPNSHLKFDIVASLASLTNDSYCYTCNNTNTYFLLREGSNSEEVSTKITGLAADFLASKGLKYDYKIEYHLQKLRDIHLHSNYRFEHEANGNSSYLLILMIIALFILLSAWLNYSGIYESLLKKEIRSFGIRKINGASWRSFFFSITTETLLAGSIGLLLGYTLLALLFHPLKSYLSLVYTFDYIINFQTIIYSICAIAGISTLVGFVLSLRYIKTIPLNMIRKKAVSGGGRKTGNWILITQFCIAIFLIASTFIAIKQIHHMQVAALSMDMNQVLTVKRPVDKKYNAKQKQFEESLKRIPGITGTSYSTISPGERNSWVKGGITIKNSDKLSDQIYQSSVAPGFFDFFGVELLAGRLFYPNETNWNGGKRHLVLNKQAALALGTSNYSDIIGKVLVDNEDSRELGEVVGVVDGYFQNSLDKEVIPTLFNPDQFGYFIFIKLNGKNPVQLVSKIKAAHGNHFKDTYFEYYFLDDYFNAQYQSYIQFNRCFILFAIIAIIIAALSLLGVVIMRSASRIKEIGVRKVNGARTWEILSLLNRDFLRGVVIAILISTPAAYYAMNKWLENFAYKTTLSWWIFALAGALAIGIALFTVSFQSYKAATRNPIESLRYE